MQVGQVLQCLGIVSSGLMHLGCSPNEFVAGSSGFYADNMWGRNFHLDVNIIGCCID